MINYLAIAARIAAGKEFLFRVHVGPVAVKEVAESFREAGITVDSVGTEAIYILVNGSDKLDAINNVLNTLKSNLGKTFGLTPNEFKSFSRHVHPIKSAHTAAKPLPEDLEDIDSGDEPKFMWHSKPGPGDWFPDQSVRDKPGYGGDTKETLKDGDSVTWTGNRKFEKMREKDKENFRYVVYDVEFREIVTPTGFIGWTDWYPHKPGSKSGFEPIGSVQTAAILPRQGDNVEITPIGPNEFSVRGQLTEELGGPLWLEGILTALPSGELEYEPQGRGTEGLMTDEAYDALADIMNVLNPH